MTSLFIILLLILGVIFFLLLMPLTYSCEIITYYPLRITGRIQWLGKIFYVFFAYEEGKPIYKEVYILTKAKAGQESDYEDWLAKRTKEESLDAEDAVTDTDNQPTEESSTDENELTLKEKIALAKKWAAYFLLIDVLKECLTLVHRIYRHSLPRKIELEGTVGLGDPAYTGMLAGFLYSLWPHSLNRVNFDFFYLTCVGRCFMSGRIYFLVLFWYVLRFLWAKPIRGILWTVIKGGH